MTNDSEDFDNSVADQQAAAEYLVGDYLHPVSDERRHQVSDEIESQEGETFVVPNSERRAMFAAVVSPAHRLVSSWLWRLGTKLFLMNCTSVSSS